MSTLPQAAAFAEEPQNASVPCIGPMCMLTPFYKLGSMMPGAPTTREPPASTSPLQAPSPQASASQAQGESPSTDVTPASPAAQSGADAGNTAPATASASDDRDKAAPNEPSRRQPPSRRHASRRPSGQAQSASRSVRQPRDDSADAAVTIATDGPEIERLLRLAAVVTAPPIRIVPAVAVVDGCRAKPADFVVDTMSNPNRVGPAIPLFTESLMIIARKDVADLAGLRGRKVSFGLPGGSSQRVAGRVFRSLAIDVDEQPLDIDNALDGLASGDLDAVALLVPQGFDRLNRHDPQLHLLALPETMVPPDGLKLSRIDPSSYMGGTWSVPSLGVVTVDAVLSPSRPAAMQPNAQAVYAALDRRSSELADNGFDLIGGGGLTTRRSSARDASPAETAKLMPDTGC